MGKTPASMLPLFRAEKRPVDMSSEPHEQPGQRSATWAVWVLPLPVLVMVTV